MILAVDIGNLSILLGGYDSEKLCFTARCASDRTKTEDEYFLLIRDLLGLYQVKPEQIDGAILSSVVPVLKTIVTKALERLIGKKILVVGAGLKSGLNIKIDDPGALGSDMVVNAVGALLKYPRPFVIFDLENVTSMSVISKDGAYIGGALIPGLKISADAMSASSAQLPYITLSAPGKLVCSSTVSCMQSGVMYGCAAIVDGLSYHAEEELGENATIILTGRFSELIAPLCRRKIEVDPNLCLDGLMTLYKKNQPKRK